MAVALCTKNPVSRTQVGMVSVPDTTDTYMPVGNAQFVDMVEHTFCDALAPMGLMVKQERFGLTSGDQRMFGVLQFGHNTGKPEAGDFGLSVGIRNSYDKSMAAGLAVGASVFVCDNMVFTASGVVLLRRHTRFVWEDLQEMVSKAALQAWDRFQILSDDIGDIKAVEITDDRAYELLGLLYGRGVINGTQIRAARQHWQHPPQEDFQGNSLWHWYNAVNDALKTAQAHEQIEAHTALHDLAMAQVPARFTALAK